MLFVFGPTKDSWIIGNDKFTMQYGMPSNVANELESGQISAKDVQWCSVGQGGVLCFYKWSSTDPFRFQPDQGDLFFSQTENLKADLNSGGVEHVTFASGGGWFVRYRNGNVRLSMEGTFPAIFDEVASANMTTKGSSRSQLQTSTISNVFFGADDAILIQFGVPSVPIWENNAALKWRGLPANLVTNLTELFNEGWVLSKRTNLCSWNKEYFYVEWTKPYSTATKALYQLPPHAMLPALFVRQMWEGEYPTSIPQPAPEKPVQSKPKPPALPPRNKSDTAPEVTVEMIQDMCNDLFEQYSDSQETMDGTKFKAFCQKLLPKKELARVWDLSDADGNGTFSRDEFTIAVYLIVSRKRGSSLPHQVPYEHFLKAQEPNKSRCARRTFLLSKDFKPVCCFCQDELVIGCWKCVDCQVCATQGLLNRIMLCVKCFCSNDTSSLTLTEAGHKPTWTKIVRANINTGEIKEGINFCDLCGKVNRTGHRLFYYCANQPACDFDSCKSCHEPGQLCPNGHILKSDEDDDDELESGFESMNLRGANSSNPFLNDDDDDEGDEKGGTDDVPSSKPSKDATDDDKALRGRISSSIVKEKPNVKWEDVAGLEKAKEELQEAVILPAKFPKLFSGKRKARRGILLYGPPGTGKSYLAKAVATEANSTLFSIGSSDVMSKWLGESERLIKTLFDLARENKPSVVFIDELDALCGSRDEPGHNPHMAGLKTEIMIQMDGVGHDNEGVLVLAATNLPWTLDPAIRRRLQRKIYIALPDEPARAEMFKIHVGNTPCGLTPDHYATLGRVTHGLSGSDIGNAVQDALMQPVKKVSSSKHWKKVIINGTEKLTPCKPNEPGAMPMNWRQVPASKLHESIVIAEDFFEVLQKVKPTVSQGEIQKYLEWTEQFGMEGS